MGYEILYTSAPSGLKPGSSGYCTVQSSRGIPAPAVDLLESLSGYRHVFTPGSPEAAHNPVNWGHYIVRIAGRSEHVLSRVGDCELDYTGRSNKLAHHAVVDAMAVATLPGGPAWFLARPGQMRDQWDGTVSQLGNPRTPAPERRTAGQCAAWGGATGDAGWGGVLAESFLADPERKVFVIYKPGTNLLALFEEAIALLPEHRRWDVTFATYGAALPKTVECLWSGLVADSPEVAQSHRFVNALRIDLTNSMGQAAGGQLVSLARTGVAIAPISTPRRPAPSPVPVPESVYEGGYQPVPPPPAVLAASLPAEEPEPPSLPTRRGPRNSSSVSWILLSVSVVLLVGIFSAIVVIAFKQLRPAAPALDLAQSKPSDSMGNRESLPIDATPSDGRGSPDAAVPAPTPKMSGTDGPAAAGESDRSSVEPPATPPAPKGAMTSKSIDPAEEPKKDESKSNGDAPKAPDKSMEKVPTEKDVAPKSKPVINEAAQKSPTVFTALTQTPGEKDRKKQFRFVFPKDAAPPFLDASRGSFMVPRPKRGVEKSAEAHDVLRQRYNSGQFALSPVTSIGTDAQLHGTIAPDPTSPSILIFEDSTQTDSFRTCFRNGIFLLQDSLQNFVVLRFAPIARTVEVPRLQNYSIRVAVPSEMQPLVKFVNSEDIFIDNIQLTIDEIKLTPDRADQSVLSWDFSEYTEGLIGKVHVNRAVSINEQNDTLTVKLSSPDFLIASDKQRIIASDLQRYFTTMNTKLTKFSIPPIPKLLHHNSPEPNKDDEPLAVKRLITDIEAHFKLVRDSTDEKNKDKLDAIEVELQQETANLNRYLSNSRAYRHKKHLLDSLHDRLKTTSLTVSYRVWAFQKSDDTDTVAELPSGKTYWDVNRWIIGSD